LSRVVYATGERQMKEAFMPGDSVEVRPGHSRFATGVYEVVRQLPDERGKHQYRIRSLTGGPEMLVMEEDLVSITQRRDNALRDRLQSVAL
jgi:hypothetical protein